MFYGCFQNKHLLNTFKLNEMLAVPYSFVAMHTNSPRWDASIFSMDNVVFSEIIFALWCHWT